MLKRHSSQLLINAQPMRSLFHIAPNFNHHNQIISQSLENFFSEHLFQNLYIRWTSTSVYFVNLCIIGEHLQWVNTLFIVIVNHRYKSGSQHYHQYCQYHQYCHYHRANHLLLAVESQPPLSSHSGHGLPPCSRALVILRHCHDQQCHLQHHHHDCHRHPCFHHLWLILNLTRCGGLLWD